MTITLYRFRRSRYGIDGYIEISGIRRTFTTEHPIAHLPPGEYPITLNHLIFKKGNGPFRNLDGSICVGELYCRGCVIKSAAAFQSLYNRIQKSLKRGTPVTLLIT